MIYFVAGVESPRSAPLLFDPTVVPVLCYDIYNPDIGTNVIHFSIRVFSAVEIQIEIP